MFASQVQKILNSSHHPVQRETQITQLSLNTKHSTVAHTHTDHHRENVKSFRYFSYRSLDRPPWNPFKLLYEPKPKISFKMKSF